MISPNDRTVLAALAAAVACVVACRKATTETPANDRNPRAATVARDGGDPSGKDRLVALRDLAARKDLSPAHKTRALLDELRRECATPTVAPPVMGSYLSLGALIKLELAEALGHEGPEATRILREAAAGASGETREWIGIALAFAKVPESASELRGLLRTSASGDVRQAAASLLGELHNREAIPELRRALEDPYHVEIDESDLGRRVTIYPVREEAAGALEALGLTIERTDDRFRVVE